MLAIGSVLNGERLAAVFHKMHSAVPAAWPASLKIKAFFQVQFISETLTLLPTFFQRHRARKREIVTTFKFELKLKLL